MNRKLKRILKQPANPPSSKRHCLYCDKLTKFKYDRMVGHSACVNCGCRYTKRIEKEVENGNKRKSKEEI